MIQATKSSTGSGGYWKDSGTKRRQPCAGIFKIELAPFDSGEFFICQGKSDIPVAPGDPLLDQGLQLFMIGPIAHDDMGKRIVFINVTQIVAQFRCRHDGLRDQAAVIGDDSSPRLFRTRSMAKIKITPPVIGVAALRHT